ncbi:autophagy-related protein 13a-like [Papaver somniferum]|uniref:autophagy-related protein 13a-like n=1 Tax=Papaver somniferum TaxID=3469 RepID=UPI000E6F7B11|nr:autophagy-related protein 13a-like [Papaver somniferum]
MAFHGSPHSESGRSEQIISQFLLKSLHIILDSRIPPPRSNDHSGDLASAGRARKSDKWFHLALGDRPAALENLHFWHRNLMDPMIIDIILVHDDLGAYSSDDLFATPSERATVETVVERWVVQYESPKTMLSQPSEGSISYGKTYKKSIILLRSLYSMMRLLPAYRIFRRLSTSNQTCSFDIIYKVSSFSEPFSREEEETMKVYNFAPVEAHPGRLCISTTYRPTLSDFNLELSTSLPPQLIMDYVGSPATDPLKIFPSAEDRATSFPLRGAHPSSSSPFQRPHSWTPGLHRAAPFTQNYRLSGSPPAYRTPPTPSDYSPSPPDIYSQRSQSYKISSQRRGLSSDEYQLSPPFSPSPSPSPPTHVSGFNSLHSRLRSERSESAPVNIPMPMIARNSRLFTHSSSDPNRHALPPMSPRSTKYDHSSQESSSGSRSFRRMDASRAAELPSGIANLNLYCHKEFKDGKDDSGRFSGLMSSSGSPCIGFSRSSSRLSFQDDLDDCEFSCPFAVDDVDMSDTQIRTFGGKEASDSSTSHAFSSTRKSQDAAIGVLVHTLKTAPPLRQDQSCYSSQSSKNEFDGEVSTTASGFFVPRKTSDALEELRSYRDMKDLLLSQSGNRDSTDKRRTS